MSESYRCVVLREWCSEKCAQWVPNIECILRMARRLEPEIPSWHYSDDEQRLLRELFREHAVITYRDFCLWAELDEEYVTLAGEIGLDEDETVKRMSVWAGAEPQGAPVDLQAHLSHCLLHLELDMLQRNGIVASDAVLAATFSDPDQPEQRRAAQHAIQPRLQWHTTHLEAARHGCDAAVVSVGHLAEVTAEAADQMTRAGH